MKIVVAPDSFKGSLTSQEAGECMRKGIARVFPEAQIVKAAVADGGEGTVNAIVSMTSGHLEKLKVEGPLGETVEASFGICPSQDGDFAVIEMAEASGLLLEPQEQRNVMLASTYGTGQLIRAALDKKVKKIIIGIGGSATNDGGAGMAEALGVRFLDAQGNKLPRGGAALAQLDHIDCTALDPRLKDIELLIASDVKNPLCGPDGASYVYGPQKGAEPKQVEELDAALLHYGRVCARDAGLDALNLQGAGAAGGLGAGLMIFAQGRMCNGIETVLDLIGFEELVKDASLVFTGEGFSDSQTANGKTPVGVAHIANKYQIPVICLSGGISQDAKELLNHGIAAVNGTPCAPVTLQQCIAEASSFLEDAAERCARLVKIGLLLKTQ
ncbi:MAG: glycerate kinase [Succinivibrio sp.]|nr:glycerate kinase [Succinivibrio sp.]